ncbi:MAG: signal peptidase II [Epulopiscium sp.]|nr:signal peptidase II [Candidatus Epulonipiscium sp.]
MQYFLAVSLLVALDQVTKYVAFNYLQSIKSIPIIKDVFHLTFVKNRGAAFGILQNQRWFFIIMTIAVLLGIIYYYKHLPKYKPYGFIRIALILISAGAIGNLIDRIRLGFVIDFFDFCLINFPVFNVADICVVIGTILLAWLILFTNEEDLEKKEVE